MRPKTRRGRKHLIAESGITFCDRKHYRKTCNRASKISAGVGSPCRRDPGSPFFLYGQHNRTTCSHALAMAFGPNPSCKQLGFKQHSELGTRGDTAIFRGDELEGHELEGTLLFFGWCLRTARTLFTGSHLVSLYRQSVRRKGPLSWPCGAAANTFAFERAKR